MFTQAYEAVTTLAKHGTRRSVKLLRNRQLDLQWDYLIVRLQMSDLLVLQQALQRWELEMGWDFAAGYLLWLDNHSVSVSRQDAESLNRLLAEAAAQLPRQVVRWANLQVRLEPHQPNWHNGLSQFSQN